MRGYNMVFGLVPFSLKYGVGQMLRRRRPPYSLIGLGSIVVQVGAPRDILQAGRSRAVHFCLRTGPMGRVIIVEPDPENTKVLEQVLQRRGLFQASVHTCAAWSETAVLRLRVNSRHPASNFTEGCADLDPKDVEPFEIQEVAADSLDNILAKEGIDRVDLVSITTNGAEIQILEGFRSALTRQAVDYVALARTGERREFESFLSRWGFSFLTHDDRGYTFQRVRAAPDSPSDRKEVTSGDQIGPHGREIP